MNNIFHIISNTLTVARRSFSDCRKTCLLSGVTFTSTDSEKSHKKTIVQWPEKTGMINNTRVASHLAHSDTPNITWVVSRVSRSDTPTLFWRPPTNRKAPHVPLVRPARRCYVHVYPACKKWPLRKKYESQKYEKITDSWECGREHNLRFWWHQPFRSCQSNTSTNIQTSSVGSLAGVY